MAFRKTTTDMTSGAIHPQILKFALPLIAGNLFQQLYNTVDSIIVGNYVGKSALAAIGSTGTLSNAIIGFFMGLAAGGSVIIAQQFGSRDISSVRRTIHTLITGGFFAGIFLLFFGHLTSGSLLRFMSTPDDVFTMADSYLKIYFDGILFQLMYNICAGILRALGDSRRPLYFLAISSLINVALDILFVMGFNWGIEGAAWATVISQAVSMILVLAVMFKSSECYKLVPAEFGISADSLIRVLKQGVPGGIQMAITAFSNVFVLGYINHFDSACMAGWTSFNKIDQISLLPIQSVSLAATTFVGQNYGAHNWQRIKQGVWASILLAIVWIFVLFLVFELFPAALVGLFNRDGDVLYYGTYFLKVGAFFYIFRILNQVLGGVLRGLGNALAPTIVMLSSFVVFRQLYLFIVTRLTKNFLAVALAYPVGWGLCGILMTIVYLLYIRTDSFKKYFSNLE